MAKNAPRHTTEKNYTPKAGQLGEWFLMFEIDQARTGKASKATSQLYDYSWNFFKDVLEPLTIRTMGPRKPLSLEERMKEETKIIDALKAKVNEAVRKGTPKPITVNTYLRNIQSFLNWCRKKRQGFTVTDFDEDFVETLRLAEGDEQIVILTDDQIKRFTEYAPKSFNQARVWTMGMMMLDNGVRQEGALDLLVSDVDFSNNVISIIGKGNKTYMVSMSDELYPVLRQYKMRWIDPWRNGAPNWYFFGTHDPSCAKKKGKNKGTLNQSGARNMLRDIKVVYRKAGVIAKDAELPPRLAFHLLRHTCATKRLEAGWPIEKVQHMLNHEDLRTTRKYLHVRATFLQGGFSETSPLNSRNLDNSGSGNWRRDNTGSDGWQRPSR